MAKISWSPNQWLYTRKRGLWHPWTTWATRRGLRLKLMRHLVSTAKAAAGLARETEVAGVRDWTNLLELSIQHHSESLKSSIFSASLGKKVAAVISISTNSGRKATSNTAPTNTDLGAFEIEGFSGFFWYYNLTTMQRQSDKSQYENGRSWYNRVFSGKGDEGKSTNSGCK